MLGCGEVGAKADEQADDGHVDGESLKIFAERDTNLSQHATFLLGPSTANRSASTKAEPSLSSVALICSVYSTPDFAELPMPSPGILLISISLISFVNPCEILPAGVLSEKLLDIRSVESGRKMRSL